jgi:TolA-binding protein
MQYSAGSVIYFLGDEANTIFLLKKGLVDLVYQDMETGEDLRDEVLTGEFFGVSSALGRYRRDENAAAVRDSVVMIFSVNEFEQLAMSNSRIMMKMLSIFSKQLRKVHKKVADITESTTESSEEGLYRLGEYYLKNKRYTHGRHVFGRYLTYYPSGKFSAQAAKYLELVEPLARQSLAAAKSLAAKAVPAAKAPPKNAAPDDGGRVSAPLNPSSSSPAYKAEKAIAIDEAKAYYDGLGLIGQGQYQNAYSAFKAIIENGGAGEYVEKSSFDMGRCLFLLEKYDETIKFFTQMLMKYPKHPSMADVLFYIGQSHEREGRKSQAGNFYKKAMALVPAGEDGLKSRIRQVIRNLGE